MGITDFQNFQVKNREKNSKKLGIYLDHKI